VLEIDDDLAREPPDKPPREHAMERFDFPIRLGIAGLHPDPVCAEVGQAGPECMRVEDRSPIRVDAAR
jgi:hypothetical protein